MQDALFKLIAPSGSGDEFSLVLHGLLERCDFSAVIYGGKFFDFQRFFRIIGGEFSSQVNARSDLGGSDELLIEIIKHYVGRLELGTLYRPSYSDLPVCCEICNKIDPEEIEAFFYNGFFQPDVIVVGGAKFEDLSETAVLGCVEICDGSAWLVVGA